VFFSIILYQIIYSIALINSYISPTRWKLNVRGEDVKRDDGGRRRGLRVTDADQMCVHIPIIRPLRVA